MNRTSRSGRRPRVFLALADVEVAAALADHLDRSGFDVRIAPNGGATPDAVTVWGADAAVIDLDRVDVAGLALAEDVLHGAAPGAAPVVVLVAAAGDTVGRIVGLEIGADDVVTRPVSPRELTARLRALLGRVGRPTGRGRVVRIGGVGVDVDLQTIVAANGEERPLAPSEFALLKCFLDAPTRVFTRDELIERAPASDDDVMDRAIDRRIARLRRKLEGPDGDPLVEAVRGEGYRLTRHALAQLSG
ncbi:response regulator transcription factor [Oharaeibacter diazotrophicus]|uniref:Two-component system OmpR family response regulator n=1 Tax=Oharaeibacter diazotrophicus TaxID=1920512 RepID=A0A4R6R5T4_9HYPH|nr:response regulator transcription factor [Oharaeibacter diazotrophicus]TDP81189.1 two-component system OmpR family response regulator [Oharaeibacter diazotrophicus]BBE74817.1 transcriptional regulatory protein CreB [Pleomorphomonas sp. SM30]GLS75679.1 DNA-binding response regulator [Oharaeibacter diazotrophicus]